MAKEALFEELVKRVADGDQAAVDAGNKAGADAVWHSIATNTGILATPWVAALTLALVVVLACLGCLACCCLRWGSSESESQRRRHKKKMMAATYNANFNPLTAYHGQHRKSTPVFNPDKGAHYLKKSPSPTGAKSPPGVVNYSSESSDDFMLRHQHAHLEARNEEHEEKKRNEMRRHSSALETNNNNDNKLGWLHFSMRYCFEKNALVVTVNKCVNLPAKDANARSSDPYVKLQLLPEKQHKVKTRVMRRTLNPVYDEDFTFYGIDFDTVQKLTLHFVVLSFDRYSRDDVIGELVVELSDYELATSDQKAITVAQEITPRSLKLKSQGRGELLVSLCYQPAANRITAVVLKARNLPKMDITGLSDPYVKLYLLCNGQRICKKKTHVKKRTLNPVFNESFVFDLPHLDLHEHGVQSISIELQLLDWDRVTKNEIIGRLELGGSKCDGSARHHWEEVLASPRRQIAEWHKLHE